jgi:hypothetical protein
MRDLTAGHTIREKPTRLIDAQPQLKTVRRNAEPTTQRAGDYATASGRQQQRSRAAYALAGVSRDGVAQMPWTEKNELWARWRGESLHEIARALHRFTSSVYEAVGAEGGIAPRPRRAGSTPLVGKTATSTRGECIRDCRMRRPPQRRQILHPLEA